MIRGSLWPRASLASNQKSIMLLRLTQLAGFRLPRYSPALLVVGWLALAVLGGCVYRIDIQQGNVVEQEDVEQVDVGMTRSQVQFLLGTPMVSDTFHEDRWDYTYYFRQGRSRDIQRRWFIVYFEDDRVARLEHEIQPESPPS
jgi:outer membrane protein assembly factor BamE